MVVMQGQCMEEPFLFFLENSICWNFLVSCRFGCKKKIGRVARRRVSSGQQGYRG
jgi:hypothetical protein